MVSIAGCRVARMLQPNTDYKNYAACCRDWAILHFVFIIACIGCVLLRDASFESILEQTTIDLTSQILICLLLDN